MVSDTPYISLVWQKMTKPKFVFDCNVIVSAFLFKKSSPRLSLEKAKNQGIILLSESISGNKYH